MSKSFLDKFLSFIGFEEVEDSEKAPELTSAKEIKPQIQSVHKSTRTELTAVPASKNTKIISTKPHKFTEVQVVADHLKNGQAVIVNLALVRPEEAQRILDYASGVCFAVNGSAKKVNGEVFLFVPSGVDVVGVGDLKNFTKNEEVSEEEVTSRWFNKIESA